MEENNQDNTREDLGYKSYPKKPKSVSERPLKSGGAYGQNENSKNLYKTPPLIQPQKFPNEVIGDNYELVRKWLEGYQHGRMGWDIYALRIPSEERAILGNIFRECRENGFCNPHVVGEKIIWSQMVQSYLSPLSEPIAIEEDEIVDFDNVPF